MKRGFHRVSLAALLLVILAPHSLLANDLSEPATALLDKRCHMCHGAAMQMSKLDMRSRDKLLTGGERGPAVTPTNLQRSLLWRFVSHEARPHMPPGENLPGEEIGLIRRWIIAGGGIKGGTVVGATDHYGLKAVENRKSVYDLHATILHLLGLNHEQFTYSHLGRDMRLTAVHGNLIKEVLA